jgi:hypothetical protein
MPSRRPTKHPQAVSTCANHGRRVAGLDQHVEYDHPTKRYGSVARCRCGRDKVWLSGGCASSSRLIASSVLGSSDPGVGEGHEGMLRAGVPIFPQKGRPGLF